MDRFYSDKDSVIEALPPRRPEPPPLVHTLYEELTGTWQYVVADPVSRHSVIIDPHLDSTASTASTEISTIAADRVLNVVHQNRYIVDRIIHTHEPRDHPSSAWYIRTQILQTTGQAPQVSIGKKMAAVQRVFKRKYSMNDGSQWRTDFEHTFSDGQMFPIGNVTARVLHLNGGNLAFVIGQHVFAGTSRFDLEVRNRHNALVGDLSKYNVYTAYDSPPARTAKLVPIQEPSERSRNPVKKLVIRYAAEH
ncbi:hypothetical protein M409DRAFT_18742 [Zasmidium cellare ATCC 36951]|uniref:Metallo-beta-lactamase domain-containing protein n=1 Tax=Zasmidium cellare ATCC 36951 TaxID=1080233 RepID=A0A6A6CY84_ZASCE|nr:uncharacterized protein M409DRAFT_18742 [Zasmidium cellare ATCC 36951]KAF2170769.1 hypothetical protein M409DRAFT_18742 [Zasmidium cellare ATCC 36951]